MCVLQRRAKSFVKLWERGENKFLTSWELETRRVGMNEGKRPKSFSSVLLFRFSLFDEGISSFSFLFLMATLQFLFRYSFLRVRGCTCTLRRRRESPPRKKTSVVKAPGFFQVFMALKVNVTVSLLILKRLILRLLKKRIYRVRKQFFVKYTKLNSHWGKTQFFDQIYDFLNLCF